MSIWDQWAGIQNWDRVKGSAGYLTATPYFQNQVYDILYKYGIDPTGDQLQMANRPIQGNENSVVNQLKRATVEDNHSTINAANAAGLEESGAAAGALNANMENYKKNYAGAVSEASGLISGALGDYTGKVGGLFDDAQKQIADEAAAAAAAAAAAPAPGAPPQAPAPLPIGQPTGVGTGTPTPQVPYQRRGPEAGGTVVKKLAPKKIPGYGGRAL